MQMPSAQEKNGCPSRCRGQIFCVVFRKVVFESVPQNFDHLTVVRIFLLSTTLQNMMETSFRLAREVDSSFDVGEQSGAVPFPQRKPLQDLPVEIHP